MPGSAGLYMVTQNQIEGSARRGAMHLAKKALVALGMGYEPAAADRSRLLLPIGATDRQTGRLIPFFALFL